jgi:hypothetical protein
MTNWESVEPWIDKVYNTKDEALEKELSDYLKREITWICTILYTSKDIIQFLPDEFEGFANNRIHFQVALQEFNRFLRDPNGENSPQLKNLKTFIYTYSLQNHLQPRLTDQKEIEHLKVELERNQDYAKKTLKEIINLKEKSSVAAFSIDNIQKQAQTIDVSLSDLLTEATSSKELIGKIKNEIEGENENAAEIVNNIQTLKNNHEKSFNDFKLRFDELGAKISEDAKIYSGHSEEIKKLLESSTNLEIFSQATKLQLEQLLNPAIVKNLSDTFRTRKEALSIRKTRLLYIIIGYTAFILTASYFSFQNILSQPSTSSNYVIISFIRLFLPATLFFILIKEYIKERTLEEEYAFREAISTSIIAYAEQIKSDEKIKDGLIEDTVKKLYNSPIKSLSKTSSLFNKKFSIKDITGLIKETVAVANEVRNEVKKESTSKSKTS